MKPKILFTSTYTPYPKASIKKDPVDYFFYRKTYGQKLFQLRAFQSWHPLHFIAQNIAVPSTVIENYSLKSFKDEVNKGEYKIVAITFAFTLAKRVYEMVSWLKFNHPEIEIVLGGYGTVIFNEKDFEFSNELKAKVDYICFGEGVSFFNELIFKKWGIKHDKKLTQNLLPTINSFFRTRIPIVKHIIVVSGLGCSHRCSFCATSSHYNHSYIPLFKGKELFESILEQSERHPDIRTALIYDEDFLNNRKNALEFMEYFEASPLKDKNFSITIFTSVNSIKKFSIEELIRCGIGSIFIGVESMDEEVLKSEKLNKRTGEVINIFRELHQHGITTFGSIIVGFDSQNIDILKNDIKNFIELNPTFYQVVPLHLIPGTELWNKMKKDDRLIKNYKAYEDSNHDFNFEIKNYSKEEAGRMVFSSYLELVDEGGPWPFRVLEVLQQGYLNLKDSENPVFRHRALSYKKQLSAVIPLAVCSRFLFYGKGFTKRWSKTMKTCKETFPLMFWMSILFSPAMLIMLLLVYLYGNLCFHLNPLGDQPNTVRREYNGQ